MKAFHIVGPAPLCTNTFLLVTDAGHAVAIDPAADASLYEQALEQTGAKLTHILCTHGHYDHVGAVKQLKEKLGITIARRTVAKYRGALNIPSSSRRRKLL